MSGPDLLDLAVKHLRGCGFDQRADAVQALVDSYADAVDTARRAVEAGDAHRRMYELQLETSDAYRRGLENALRAGSLADAKSAAMQALA